jgi:hypothetical protein
MKLKSIALIVAAALSSATVSAAQTWDAAADFSTAQSGAWSYGWSSTLGGTFNQFSNANLTTALDSITAFQSSDSVFVYSNQTANTLTPAGTITAAPGILAQHPGSGGQISVVRWTAQQSGTYTVDAGFFGISSDPQHATTTDVHVLKNGASMFNGLVEGHLAADNFRVGTSAPLTFSLNAGDKIDFAVGYGSNGNYQYDSTRLTATIAAVPEPETYAMLLAGLGLMGAVARRRKQQ